MIMYIIIILLSLFPSIQFVYTPGVFRTEEGIELRLFLEIERGELTLIRQKDAFTAAYSISVILKRDNRERGDIWMRKVEALKYGEQGVFSDTVSLDVMPGSYEMAVIVSDLNSLKETKKIRTISVDSLPDFSISTLIPKKGERFISEKPLIGEEVIYYFEVYSDRDALLYFTFGERTDTINITPSNEGIPIRIENTISETEAQEIAVSATLLPLRGDNLMFIRRDTLSVERSIFRDDELYRDRVTALRYIGRRGEIDTLLLASPEDRQELWERFWSARDPTPKTAKNELRDEYIARIEYAEKNLGGWRTDMGTVWLVMGRPDQVESRPFELDSWGYEIWHYYSTGERFIFYDRYGLGSYDLVYPEHWTPERRRR